MDLGEVLTWSVLAGLHKRTKIKEWGLETQWRSCKKTRHNACHNVVYKIVDRTEEFSLLWAVEEFLWGIVWFCFISSVYVLTGFSVYFC